MNCVIGLCEYCFVFCFLLSSFSFFLCLFLLPFFIFLSLLSYSPLDPSIVNHTTASINNFGGSFGANIAEILIQFFGFCSYAIILPLLAWTYKLFQFKELPLFSINILSLPFFLIALGSLSYSLQFESLSGVLSLQVFQFINQFINSTERKEKTTKKYYSRL